MLKYAAADNDIAAIVADVRQRWHAVSLADAHVAIVLVTSSAEVAPACIRPTSPAIRAGGGPDAILSLDATRWEATSAPGQVALVDHGLSGVYAQRLPSNAVRLDGASRPKLRKRTPDLGRDIGFAAVLRRHKSRSVENGRLLILRDATAGEPDAPKAVSKPKAVPRNPADGPRLAT